MSNESIASRILGVADGAITVFESGYKNAEYKYCPITEAAGSGVGCEPLENRVVLVKSILPPSLEGYEKISLFRPGKNLFDKSKYPLTDGKYVVGNVYESSTGTSCIEGYVPVEHLRARYITINHTAPGTLPGLYFYTSDKTLIPSSKYGSHKNKTFLVPNNASYLRFSIHTEYKDIPIQIELGKGNTDYEEYQCDVHTVNFSTDVYGGEFDWASNTFTRTHIKIQLHDLEWTATKGADEKILYFTAELVDTGDGEAVCTSEFTKLPEGSGDIYKGINNTLEVNNGTVIVVCSSCQDIDSFKSYLASQNSQLVYPISSSYKDDVVINCSVTVSKYINGEEQSVEQPFFPNRIIGRPGINLFTCDIGSLRVEYRGNDSYVRGNITGYEEGVTDGYEEGTKDTEKSFWDNFTNNNTRTYYEHGFHACGFEYIRPPYVITPKKCRSLSMFHGCTNLKKIESAYFDLSELTISSHSAVNNGNYNTFTDCVSLEEVEDIGLQAGGYYYTFANCKSLKTVAGFRTRTATKYDRAFLNCRALENLTFGKIPKVKDESKTPDKFEYETDSEGNIIYIDSVIGQNGLSFSDSPLSYDSLTNIINALEPKSGGGFTITLGSKNIEKLTDADKARITTEKGWSLA